MERRTVLKKIAAAAASSAAASMHGLPTQVSHPVRVPAQIKAFCIDFNWIYDPITRNSRFAPPGHWADADPKKHIQWYEDLGANTVQTFAVSQNGYAWYKSAFAPPQPGLKHDFLTDMVNLGHKRQMLVMGYFNAGANSKWGIDHADLSYGTPHTWHIPFTDQYLDYLGRSIEDAIKRTGMDGFALDWVWNPLDKLRLDGWLPAEQQLFEQLSGNPFPRNGHPEAGEKLKYERKAIERCWERIKQARDSVDQHCIIFLSCKDFNDPTVTDLKMLKEVDWSMNESPDLKLYRIGKLMSGPQTRMVQNVVGWVGHDAEKFLSDPANRDLDLYGFANPLPSSLLPPIEDYLSKPIACFTGDDKASINDRNIAALARLYRGFPLGQDHGEVPCG